MRGVVGSAGGWVIEVAALMVGALLVLERRATVHTGDGLAALALTAVVAAGAAVAVAAQAGRRPAGIASLVGVLLVAGAAATDNPRAAVLAFAASALVPLVAVWGDRRWRPPRPAWVLLVLATLAAVTARVLLRDPFRELRCEPFCGSNPFLVTRSPGVIRLAELALVIASLLVVATGAAGMVRRRTAPPAETAIRIGVAALWSVAALALPRPLPDERGAVLAWSALVGLAIALALVDTVQSARALVLRRRIAEIARSLASTSDEAELQRLLRKATQDPGLVVTIGEEAPDPTGGAVQTTVVRGGRAVATITHRSATRDAVELAVTPALALAMETRLLTLQASRQVAAVQRSREHAVAAANDARRRLERDLHDGAQQQLLVAGMLLAAAADERPDPVGLGWRVVAADVADALTDLRRLGRGDAATIAELGFADAVTALTAVTGISVSAAVLRCGTNGHDCWPEASAIAAYRLLAGTVADADRGNATAANIEAACLGPGRGFEVDARHDGESTTDRAVDRDRVMAVGGRIEPTPDPRAVRAWFP